MTLEENIQQLRDSLTVTSAQTLRHETRLKDHQQWTGDIERAFTRIAALDQVHSEKMVKLDGKITQIAAAALLSEEKISRLSAKVDAFIDFMRKGGNGHHSPDAPA